jgi:hypothetical protein
VPALLDGDVRVWNARDLDYLAEAFPKVGYGRPAAARATPGRSPPRCMPVYGVRRDAMNRRLLWRASLRRGRGRCPPGRKHLDRLSHALRRRRSFPVWRPGAADAMYGGGRPASAYAVKVGAARAYGR